MNGKPTATQKTDVTGLIVIPIAAGDSDVRIDFRRTIDRFVGNIFSLISLAVLVVAYMKMKTQPKTRLGRPRNPLFPLCFPWVSVFVTTEDAGEHLERTEGEDKMGRHVLVATSNAGKLRDFSGAAAAYGIRIANIPHFAFSPPQVVEDGATFEANARKKAECYSLAVPGELV